jgi:hypothetical protein
MHERLIPIVIPAYPEKGGKGRRRSSTAEWLVILLLMVIPAKAGI